MKIKNSPRNLSFEPVVNSQPRHLSCEQIEFYNQHGFVRSLPIFSENRAQENRAYFDVMLQSVLEQNDGRNAYSINGYQTNEQILHDRWAKIYQVWRRKFKRFRQDKMNWMATGVLPASCSRF